MKKRIVSLALALCMLFSMGGIAEAPAQDESELAVAAARELPEGEPEMELELIDEPELPAEETAEAAAAEAAEETAEEAAEEAAAEEPVKDLSDAQPIEEPAEEPVKELDVQPRGGETEPCARHSYALVKAKAATCEEDGHRAYYQCSVCGANKTEPVIIPATGHKAKVVPAVEKTCTEDGHSEYTVCSVCKTPLTTPVIYSALGHDYVFGECTVCGRTSDIESIALNSSMIYLGVKDTYQIMASVSPMIATNHLVYSSTDPSVAKVDGNGLVTALKQGNTDIYVMGDGKSTSLRVYVRPGISKLELDKKTELLEVNDYKSLYVNQTGTSINDLTWSSSAPSIVNISVGAGGYNAALEGVAPGTATIKVQASNGICATCKVTVVDPTSLVSVDLVNDRSEFTVGEETEFQAETVPAFYEEESDVTVTFKSSNTRVMTVDADTGTAVALAAGTTVITATAVQGRIKKIASRKVTVIPADKVQSIYPDKEIPSKMTTVPNDTYNRRFYSYPKSASVTFSVKSSNPSVVSAEMNDGVLSLSAIGLGTSKITVTGTDTLGTKKTYTSTITVYDPEVPVALNCFTATGTATGTVPVDTLDYRVYVGIVKADGTWVFVGFGDTSAYDIACKSSNTSIATVDESGYITPMKPGKVTISITVKYGKIVKTGKVTIQVLAPDTLSGIKLDNTSFEGRVGGRKKLIYYLDPVSVDRDAVSVKFTSSNPKLATVDANGYVDLLAPGTVTITVTATQGKVKKTATARIKILSAAK